MNGAPEVRLTVALVTRNRPESLERALASLRRQSVQPWEIIVSDDSDPAVARQTADVAVRHGCRYVAGPRRGLYANRNASLAAARGSHVRTMDDDHELPDAHVAACIDAVKRDPGAVWLLSEVQPWRDDQRLAPPGQIHPRGFLAVPPQGVWPWSLADGAAIYPRALLDRGLRFFEGFAFGAVYLEWGSLLWSLGCRMRTVPDTWLVHHAPPDTIDRPMTPEVEAAQLFAVTMLALRRRGAVSVLVWAVITWVNVILRGRGLRSGVPAARAVRVRRRHDKRLCVHRSFDPSAPDLTWPFGRVDDSPPPFATPRAYAPRPAASPVALHRVAHHHLRRGRPRTARVVATLNRWIFGGELSPHAEIGPGLMLPSGARGVVIRAGARVGVHVTILPGAEVGAVTIPDGSVLGTPA